MRYTLNIGWLYPELMSTYGDRGNIICLEKRCEWRGMDVNIQYLDLGFRIYDLQKSDLLFMGGAQDRQQKIVINDFKGKKAKVFIKMVEEGTPGLFICGAYQFLGKYYKPAKGARIPGLGILDLYTEHPGEEEPRLIGNSLIQLSTINYQLSIPTLVGFENHGGRTYLGKGVPPLGKVLVGYGNNGDDKTEGAVYKNAFGSYLHGPILPKNPHLADFLIQKALFKKHGKVTLAPLDDKLEWQAHKAIARRIASVYN